MWKSGAKPCKHWKSFQQNAVDRTVESTPVFHRQSGRKSGGRFSTEPFSFSTAGLWKSQPGVDGGDDVVNLLLQRCNVGRMQISKSFHKEYTFFPRHRK